MKTLFFLALCLLPVVVALVAVVWMRWPLMMVLALCVPASAALPPFPTVKRPAPLLSPKAASAPKTVAMVKASSFTPASELPRLPMTGGIAYTAEGEFYFVAAAWKPKNTGLIMAWSTKANGPYSFLDGWGPYPEDEWVSGIAWTAEPTVFIRATPGSPTTDMSPASGKNATKFPGRFIKLTASKTRPQMPVTPQRTPTP